MFNEYFKNGKLHEFFADQALYFVVTAVLAVVCFWACDGVSAWLSCVAFSGQAKLLGLVDLTVRFLFCSLITIVGFFVSYHRTMRYQDAMEWIKKRYHLFVKAG